MRRGLGAMAALLACACSSEPTPRASVTSSDPLPWHIRRPAIGRLATPHQVALTDVTAAAGLPNAATDCLVFEDLDGDARPDLLIAVPSDGVYLAHNAGDGSFALAPLGVSADTDACTAGDFDGDGIVDVAIGHQGGLVTLLRGLGGGAFADASSLLTGVQPVTGAWLSSIGFIDANADGRLDLYLLYFAVPASGTELDCAAMGDDYACHANPPFVAPPPLLLSNQGSSFSAGPLAPGAARSAWAAGVIDWDGDGRSDLFQSVDFGENALWLNDGLTDAWPATGAALYNHAMGAGFGDFDRDGDWDVFIADLGPSQLWFRNGDALADRAVELGIAEATQYSSSWSPIVADLDQDGWLDLFVTTTITAKDAQQFCEDVDACEGLLEERVQWDFLFTADGDGGFIATQLPRAANIPTITSASAAAADFDGDGDIDIVQAYESPPALRLLRNDTADKGHWLALRLSDATSAVGALVEIERGAVVDRRMVHGEPGGLGKSWHVAHFGLGDDAAVDRIRVRWPSGKVQTIDGPVEADQLIELSETR